MTRLRLLAASALFLWLSLTGRAVAQDPDKAAADMAAMMEKARRFTEPAERHKALERFLGKWEVETLVFTDGKAGPPEKGTAEFGWLMTGRWLKSELKGTLLGNPVEGFMIMGYDNFKMSYVVTSVTSFDTAMLRSEGDMDAAGKVLLTYGTLDEYLTGEHDKMVKYVWRFVSADRIVHEVHDLPVGETNTKVIEMVFTRR